MEVLYLLVPLSVALAGLVVWALLWAVRSGQFEDLDGAAHRILLDDEDRPGVEPIGAAREESDPPPRGEPSPERNDSPKIDDARLASSDHGSTDSRTS